MSTQERFEAGQVFDDTAFWRTCGRFASGVTVVLTEDEEIHGMTANGFISVSLEPPLVLISVGVRTRTHERLVRGERYSVSVLGHEQKAVAEHFAARPTGVRPEYARLGGFPVVPGSIARLVCRVVDRHPAGDHTLFVGQVEHMEHDEGLPLVFSSGRLFSPLDEDRP
ncbi:MAG TPA: flavin reductase family protein [Nakamurella sp.]